MSISQALGISEDKLFKEIPKERIKHIGENYSGTVDTCSIEVVKINANNEEDKKVLRELYGLQ